MADVQGTRSTIFVGRPIIRVWAPGVERLPFKPVFQLLHSLIRLLLTTGHESMPQAIQALLFEKIRQADRIGASDLLESWANEHGWERLLTDVLEPTLKIVGEEWQAYGTFTIAQAYVAAKIMEDILSKLLMHSPNATEENANKGPIVIGNIEDDFHTLGRRMVSTYLKVRGWKVIDLGNDVQASEFVNQAVANGAKVVGASAMVHSTAKNILKIRKEIDRRGLKGKLQLAVGGAIFLARPDLVEEVGGDGTAANAISALTLFTDLWKKAEEAEAK